VYLQSLWGTTRKFKGDKNAIFLHILPYLLNIWRKFNFLISQGTVAIFLRSGGYCRVGFVANFMRFSAVQ